MSIIERAAELLGSLSQALPKAPTPSQGAGKFERDLIERAAVGIVRDSPHEGAVAANSVARDKRRRAGGTGRTLKVDRNRLRRQSMITPEDARTAIAESFRRVKRQVLANVASAAHDAPPSNLVMVTSALTGEGKTFCAINLAISIAMEMDRTALLVDADVAKQNVPRTLGLETDKGLMEVLLDRRLDLADVLWKTDIGSLALMPAGMAQKHATELLASGAMRDLLREMAARYHDRIIIFDSPPLLAASEASVLASQMGQIIVVVEAGKTSEATLRSALGLIDTGKVAGLLLNKGEDLGLKYGYASYG